MIYILSLSLVSVVNHQRSLPCDTPFFCTFSYLVNLSSLVFFVTRYQAKTANYYVCLYAKAKGAHT